MLNWILSSSVLILGIVGIRALFHGKMKCRLQYMLWGLVLLRLLIPFSIGHSSYSVSNVGNAMILPEPVIQEEIPPVPESENIQKAEPERVQSTQVVVSPQEVQKNPFDEPENLLTLLWTMGSVVVFAIFLGSNLLFHKKLLYSRHVLQCSNSKLPVFISNQIKSPCLFGIWSPKIYVTEQVAENSTMLRHTLAHELCHYSHGDHIWAILRGLCLVIHWYNPLVWWAAVLSQRDAELACDEDTIRALGEEERTEYGSTLIQVTCQKSNHLLRAATTMTSNKKVLKERITSIAKKPRNVVSVIIAVSVIAVVFVGCTFTGADSVQEEPIDSISTIETTDPITDLTTAVETEPIETDPPVYVEFPKLAAGDPVPEECTYQTAAGELLEAGAPMPAEALEGDIFTSQQFIYTCRQISESVMSPDMVLGWAVTFNREHVNKMRLTEFTEIMYEQINGLNVLSINRGFTDFDALLATPPLPNTITDMGGAFMKCMSLQKITNFPSGVRDLTAAFLGCMSLKQTPALPESLEMMTYSFQFCEKLTQTPDYSACLNLRAMDGAFKACAALKSAVRIPENVTSLNETFSGCIALQGEVQVDARNLMSSNCRDTFKDCTGLILKGDTSPETLDALSKTGTEIQVS